MRYKTKFNLLRDEVVKANNELVDNKVFEKYMNEEQDTIMITNCIVKALVKTIKFYEQADHKLDNVINYALTDCNEYLKDNLMFKKYLRDFISLGMDHREASARALVCTIADINEKVDNLKDLNTSLALEKAELENEISKISALFNEKENTIIKRDNEIDALKHMLDRKDND